MNRNYDFKFGLNDVGSSSNPCDEDYRGEYAFSEPETNNIKKFVENHSTIVSGINIHTYGNVWIYPFNFKRDPHGSELSRNHRLLFDFYKELEQKVRSKDHHIVFGNASFTLDYPSNGEASDWLVGAKNILALDMELGSKEAESNKFYPPKNLVYSIVKYNYGAFQ